MLSSNTASTSSCAIINAIVINLPVARRAYFVGMHFFSPIAKIPFVELIRSSETTDAAHSELVAFVACIGKYHVTRPQYTIHSHVELPLDHPKTGITDDGGQLFQSEMKQIRVLGRTNSVDSATKKAKL